MSCCGYKRKPTEEVEQVIWKFHHGSDVLASSFNKAVTKLENTSITKFWASETCEKRWDVQFNENVIVHDIEAESVIEAVKKAKWITHLDASFKKLKE